jgi:pyruvate-formate lyase-activating enzyme
VSPGHPQSSRAQKAHKVHVELAVPVHRGDVGEEDVEEVLAVIDDDNDDVDNVHDQDCQEVELESTFIPTMMAATLL